MTNKLSYFNQFTSGTGGGGGGGVSSAYGSVSFTSVSAGAFAIALSSAITPLTAIFNGFANVPIAVGTASILDPGQLPSAPGGIQVSEPTTARFVDVSITSYVAGTINGTINANTLIGGDTAILSAVGFI